MSRFFEIERRHDREIDSTLKVDLVRSSLIVNINCTIGLCVGRKRATVSNFPQDSFGNSARTDSIVDITIRITPILCISFFSRLVLLIRISQDFSFHLCISFFVRSVFRIKLEDIYSKFQSDTTISFYITLKRKRRQWESRGRDVLNILCSLTSSSSEILCVMISSSSTKSNPSGMIGLSLYLSFLT